MTVVRLGLTGGIASGKSTAAALLRAVGVPVIDADRLSREVVAPGTPALSAVADAFGPHMLTTAGTLDRAALGAHVFSAPDARAVLEHTLHPAIRALAAARMHAVEARGHTVVVYEAPLLFETGLQDTLDATLLIACRPDVQRARLMARDGFDLNAAQARIDAQMPTAEKRALATVTLDNDDSPAALADALRAAWPKLTGLPWPHV